MFKRLCIFSLPFHPNIGGLERIAMLVAQGAADSGVKVEVVTASPVLSAEDDAQFPFAITRTSSFWQWFRAFRRADVVLFMNISLHALPAALLARRPIVISHHGIYSMPDLRNRVLGTVKRGLTRFFPNISVSRYVADCMPGASAIIPNAYDEKLFVRLPDVERDRDFVFCGRLVSDKGADVLLAAFAGLVGTYPQASLTVIGDGSERQALQAYCQQHGLQKNVTFTGALAGTGLVEMLNRHRCMVIPSLWQEPFGIVALEGIACCDTVISSNRGGLPEAVGACGILVEPDIESLGQAIRAVLQAGRAGESLPGEVGDAERLRHLAKHSPQAVTRKYLDVCRRTVGT